MTFVPGGRSSRRSSANSTPILLCKLLAEAPADRRGLTPLFWQDVRPYGEVRLDMGSRLSIGARLPAEEPALRVRPAEAHSRG
jgi:hypothetical protein